MRELKAYPEYKDSGVEWIGEIPWNWEVSRLKSSVENIQNGIWGNEQKNDENDIACIRIADFDRVNARVKDKEFTIRNIPKRDQAPYLLSKGDLLIEKSGGGEKQPVGYTVLYNLDDRAVYANFMAKIQLKEKKAASGFIIYLHEALYSQRINVRSIKQTTGIQNLDIESYLNEQVAYPPFKEQMVIADFLNQKTNEITSLISDKERLIKLLEEKRQAVITETVTKGLDPTVKMKDSGIDWIGEVPEHWGFGKVGYHFEITLGKMIQPSSKNKDDELVPYLKANNVQDGFISYEKVDEMYASPSEIKKYELTLYDLLVCEGGDIARSAFVEKNLERHIFQNALHRVRGTKKGDVRYLHYLLSVVKNSGYINLLVNRATIAHFTKDKFMSLKIPYPPVDEQKKMAGFIRQKESEIESITKKIEQQISKLKEYRESLIYEVVTGKIDVREVATEIEETY
jgi:type I restriction enzyme S subunit